MIFLPLIFAGLRFISRSAPRWTQQWRDAQQVREGIDVPKGE
jgi:hypothetical protein